MFADERHQIATRIAQKLRDADVGCELVEFLPTEAAVVRRDRIVVVLALILLSALAWSYLLWLSADMGMGGMDMSGFRMIPSQHGAYGAGAHTVAGDRVRIRIRHVDRDDGRHDGAFGGADNCHVCSSG